MDQQSITEESMTIEITRRVPVWSTETWHVAIPHDTPEGQIVDAALEALHSGTNAIVVQEELGEPTGALGTTISVTKLDGNIDSATKLDAEWGENG